LRVENLLDGDGSPAPDPRKPLFIVHDDDSGAIHYNRAVE
jgi:hypothetical protein